MKKILLLSFLIFIGFSNSSQAQGLEAKSVKKNELKLNVLSFLFMNYGEFSYERLLSDESALGVHAGFGFGDSESLIYHTNYLIEPYYRLYFGKKVAAGFFVEGNGHLGSLNVHNGNLIGNNESYYTEEFTGGLGVSTGGKFLTRSGIVMEIYLGVKRNFTKSRNDDNVGALLSIGATIGKRF